MAESFELDPFTLATDGVLRPVSVDPSDGYCPGLFSLASGGSWYIPEPAAAGLADPYVGPSRFNEPFDRGYYLWRYGDQVLEQARPAIGRALLRRDLVARLPVDDALAESRRLEDQAIERDLLELELYVAEVTAELESDRVESDRLEDNLLAAREALSLLMARQQQRVRNQQLAAASAINILY